MFDGSYLIFYGDLLNDVVIDGKQKCDEFVWAIPRFIPLWVSRLVAGQGWATFDRLVRYFRIFTLFHWKKTEKGEI